MNFQIRTSRLPLFLLLAAMASVAGGDPSRTDGPATSSATPPSTAAAAVSRLRGAILDGASSQRLRALGEIPADPATWAALNDEMLEAFHRAAGDPDPRVRAELARIAGNRWIWGAVEQHPRAVELMIRLARDEDRKVRYNAVYSGLSTASAGRQVRQPTAGSRG